jgi:hypothetical protein
MMAYSEIDRNEIGRVYLEETKNLVLKHIEELKLVSESEMTSTTLTNSEYVELLIYRKSIRDCVGTSTEPDTISKPTFVE